VLSAPAHPGALARRLRRAALAAGLAGALVLAAHERRELAEWPALVRQAQASLAGALAEGESSAPLGGAGTSALSGAAPGAPGAASRP
jgi:hypothetical protein